MSVSSPMYTRTDNKVDKGHTSSAVTPSILQYNRMWFRSDDSRINRTVDAKRLNADM